MPLPEIEMMLEATVRHQGRLEASRLNGQALAIAAGFGSEHAGRALANLIRRLNH